MLIDKANGIIIHAIAGRNLTPAEVEQAAKLKGTKQQGVLIRQVAYLFIDSTEADANLATIKRFGCECRAYDDTGHERVIFAGTTVGSTNEAPVGMLLPVLREESWPHLDTAVHRRLLTGPANAGPWVTFGIDTPQQIIRLGPQNLQGRTLGDVEGEAVRNLAKRPMKIEKLKTGTGVSLSDEYGAEALLVPEILKKIGKMLGVSLYQVGVPKEGGFLAAPIGEQESRALVAWTRDQFDSAKCRRVSPLPLLISEGQVTGFVSLTNPGQMPDLDANETGSEAAIKPWWKFW